MIRISLQKSRQYQTSNRMIQLKFQRLRQQLEQLDYNISDQNCEFVIYPGICLKQKFMSIRLKIIPRVGLYQNIDFDVCVYFELEGLLPPKIINDRRIFHPNLDPFTMQFALKELIEWVPSLSVGDLLRKLKYTVIQPNMFAIPNNPICRKAAYLYKIDRQNFRSSSVIQFSPLVLENVVLRQMGLIQERRNNKKFVQIGNILPMSRVSHVHETGEETINLLSRKFCQLHMEDSENKIAKMSQGDKKKYFFEAETMEEELRTVKND